MTTPLSEVIETLMKNLPAEEVYGVDAPIMVTMMMQNGDYKTKALDGNEEFLLKSMREGKKDLLFEFVPLDTRPYRHIEIKEKHVFVHFPELEGHCIRALGGDETKGFAAAVKGYKKKAAIDAQAEEVGKYEENGMWGMFLTTGL